jgi:hypothetical protein
VSSLSILVTRGRGPVSGQGRDDTQYFTGSFSLEGNLIRGQRKQSPGYRQALWKLPQLDGDTLLHRLCEHRGEESD